MKILLPLSLLLWASLVAPATAEAQGAMDSSGELAELERLAEDSFAEDDLPAAVALYRQLADRLGARQEKTRVLMTVAYLEHLLGRDAAALRTVSDTLAEDPDYAFQAELYNDTFREIFYQGQKRATEMRLGFAESYVRQGNEQLKSRDYGTARQHFETALTYRGDHPTALYNLALVHLYEHREDEAEAGFQKLLALGKKIDAAMQALALTNLGYLYERRGLYPEAEGFLEQAVTLDPSKARAWSILGVSRRQMGKRAEAEQAFRRAYELSPDDSQVMGYLALAYIDAKSWVEAAALLEKATDADSSKADLWLQLGLARHGLGDSAGAITAFEAAIRLDRGDAGRWASNAATQLARLHYEAGDYDAALAKADQALGWRTDLVDPRIYQGLARKSLGNLTGARESLEEARRLDPTRADTHNNLGSVYYQLGLYDEATEAFERTLEIQADFPGTRQNLEAVRQARSRPPAPPPPPGRTNRREPTPRTARLGVRFADIDYAALGLKGAMVERVEAGGPAGRAGVQKNDLILKVDGRDVANAEALKEYIASRPIGSTVALSLLRANVPKRIDVRLD